MTLTDDERLRAELIAEYHARIAAAAIVAREADEREGITYWGVQVVAPKEPERPKQPSPSAKRPRKRPGFGYEPSKRRVAWKSRDPCAYCGGPGECWDHVEPRKRGGDHSEANLTRACHSCNHEKSQRTLLVFLALRAAAKARGTWKPRVVSSLMRPPETP